MAAMSAGDCDGTAEYDLTPTTYAAGLCSEHELYNTYVDLYIAACTDLSDYPYGGYDTYWDLQGDIYKCKVDEAAKRNIDCEDCGVDAPNYTSKCMTVLKKPLF